MAGETAVARIPFGLRQTDLRLAGAQTSLVGAPAPAPIAPGTPMARAAA